MFRVEKSASEEPAYADFSTLNIEAIRSSETSFQTRSTQRHIPEDGILQIIRYFTGLRLRIYQAVP
jgi:hypothetical protein